MPVRVRTFLLLLLCGCVGEAHVPGATKVSCTTGQHTGTLPAVIPEASGVAVSRRNPGILWVHNDDGAPVIWGIDSAGTVKTHVRIAGARNIDWEDIAIGSCDAQTCLYVGDIGDNFRRRHDRVVYRIVEPALADTVVAQAIRYPFHLPGRSEDAEAIFVMPHERLYLVTKGRGGPIVVYAFPQPLQPDVDVELKPLYALSPGLVQMSDQVTGAGATSNGRFIVIRTYGTFQLYRMTADSLLPFLPHMHTLQTLQEPQGEGVDIRDDGTIFFVSEQGFADTPPPVSRVQCNLHVP